MPYLKKKSSVILFLFLFCLHYLLVLLQCILFPCLLHSFLRSTLILICLLCYVLPLINLFTISVSRKKERKKCWMKTQAL